MESVYQKLVLKVLVRILIHVITGSNRYTPEDRALIREIQSFKDHHGVPHEIKN
jgi:hypothetical protein